MTTVLHKGKSNDGTLIAYEECGEGPPLVLVHGSVRDRRSWAPVVPRLAAQFTVLTLDRRGFGASGDAVPYAIEHEFEDVAAVVDSVGEPIHLLGHSYGGICALEANARDHRAVCRGASCSPVPSVGAATPARTAVRGAAAAPRPVRSPDPPAGTYEPDAKSFWDTMQLEPPDTKNGRPATNLPTSSSRVECWCNPKRRHSSIEMRSPITFEALHAEARSRSLTPYPGVRATGKPQ